jgi:gamma-glutamylcyclotransferase (GGCT)/AIG2-like uncharacterized protein YtfP
MNETDPSTDLLFVYGSLLPQAPHSRHHLLGPVTPLGSGYFRGRLFSLGNYPGAVVSQLPADQVRGIAYRLTQPLESLPRLDRYEGFVPTSPEGCEFIRTTVQVQLDEGAELITWTYLYNLPVDGLRRIEGGDYLRFSTSAGAS